MSDSFNSGIKILPDYYSEENWGYFVSKLPSNESSAAPSYDQAAKSLDEVETELIKRGETTVRVEVDARAWERWVNENCKPLSRHTVAEFAMLKYTDDLNKTRPTWQ